MAANESKLNDLGLKMVEEISNISSKQKEQKRLDVEQIRKWVRDDNYTNILDYYKGAKSILPELLWIIPTENLINFIHNEVKLFNASGLISVGAGTGLFEWLIQKITGLRVISYESHKSKTQIDNFGLTFIEDIPECNLPSDHIMMICYGHNSYDYNYYFNTYKGPCIIIIGESGCSPSINSEIEGRIHGNNFSFEPYAQSFVLPEKVK